MLQARLLRLAFYSGGMIPKLNLTEVGQKMALLYSKSMFVNDLPLNRSAWPR